MKRPNPHSVLRTEREGGREGERERERERESAASALCSKSRTSDADESDAMRAQGLTIVKQPPDVTLQQAERVREECALELVEAFDTRVATQR
jgi:hypothetical protein